MNNIFEKFQDCLIENAYDQLYQHQKKDAEYQKQHGLLLIKGKALTENLSPAQYNMIVELEELNNHLYSEKLDFIYLQGLKDGIAIMKALASI